MADVFTTRHQIYFHTGEPVSARALANSLLGLDGVLKQSSAVVSRLTEHAGKVSMDILVESIEAGSYKENFIVRLIFGKGKEQERQIEELRVALGLKNMDAKKIIGLTIAGAVLYAGWQFVKPSDPAAITIQNSFNVIGKEANISGEELLALFKTALGRKTEELKKSAIQLTNPANQRAPSKITIDNQPEFTIDPSVIATLPKEYVKPEPDEAFKDLTNEQIMIRALDLDSAEKGWAAIIPSISETKQIKVELAEDIKVNRVPVGKYLYGDLTIFYHESKNGQKEPRRVLVRKIRLNENDAANSSL